MAKVKLNRKSVVKRKKLSEQASRNRKYQIIMDILKSEPEDNSILIKVPSYKTPHYGGMRIITS